MNDLIEKIKSYRWWTILKALAFEGGPSSTKWVYLAMNAVLAAVVIALTATICYRHARFGGGDAGMLAALVTIVGIVNGCATNALNYRRKVQAQVQTGDKPIADATTPLSMEQPEGVK